MYRGEVKLGPFRRAFKKSGLTMAEVARRMDVDERYVARLLQDTITRETAIKLGRALEMYE